MESFNLRSEECLKFIKQYNLDNFENEGTRIANYIDRLKADKKKLEKSNDPDKKINLNLLENEIKEQEIALNDFQKVWYQPKLDSSIAFITKKYTKINYLMDAMNSMCQTFKIKAEYQTDNRLKLIIDEKKTREPKIKYNDKMCLCYESKDHEKFLNDRIKGISDLDKQNNIKCQWEERIQTQKKVLQKDLFYFIIIKPEDYIQPEYIKIENLIYSMFIFPLYCNSKSEGDKYNSIFKNIFSQCYNKKYYLNTIKFMWDVDDNFENSILYMEFDNNPK